MLHRSPQRDLIHIFQRVAHGDAFGNDADLPLELREVPDDVEVGGVQVGIIGGIEESREDLGVSDILCTSSVRAVREIEPKLVISMGNVDGMVTDLKLTARTEKKLKVKNLESLPATKEVVVLN